MTAATTPRTAIATPGTGECRKKVTVVQKDAIPRIHAVTRCSQIALSFSSSRNGGGIGLVNVLGSYSDIPKSSHRAPSCVRPASFYLPYATTLPMISMVAALELHSQNHSVLALC